jgi:hypothetical protein
VIEEARQGLAGAAGEATRSAFIEPIEAHARQAAAIATAASNTAREAAERTAAGMAALAATTRALDARVTETDTRLSRASAEAMAATAALLNDRLAAAAIDLSAAMGKPMSDADWAAWNRGERGMFSRRTVGLLDKADRGRIGNLAAANPDFASAARRYVGDYDALLARLAIDPRGDALTAMLRDTATGRLASALAEGLG